MASYFSLQGIFDLPFVPVVVPIHKSPVNLQARALSAAEEDELDALQMDEYGRLITEMTTPPKPVDGEPVKLSELERIVMVYRSKPSSELAEQLAETREPEIRKRALELSGIDFTAEVEKMQAMEEGDRDKYAAEQNAVYEQAMKDAKVEIQATLELNDHENLVDQIAQININIKALTLARKAYNSEYLFRTLWTPDHSARVFETADQLRAEMSSETIAVAVKIVQEAVRTDLPFVSPEESAPNGPQPSSDTSAVDTTTGGEPTTTTLAS
jgi:hypothetical protein